MSTEEKAEYIVAMSNELSQEYLTHQKQIEDLSRALSESDYASVHMPINGDVVARVFEDSEFRDVEIDDLAFWQRLFLEAGLDSAYNTGSTIMLQKQLKPIRPHKGSFYEFVFIQSDLETEQNCQNIQPDTQCGMCSKQIDSRWQVNVMWFPSEWTTGIEDGANDPALLEEEFSQLHSRMNECVAHLLETDDL